jgi:hypothetical protein
MFPERELLASCYRVGCYLHAFPCGSVIPICLDTQKGWARYAVINQILRFSFIVVRLAENASDRNWPASLAIPISSLTGETLETWRSYQAPPNFIPDVLRGAFGEEKADTAALISEEITSASAVHAQSALRIECLLLKGDGVISSRTAMTCS